MIFFLKLYQPLPASKDGLLTQPVFWQLVAGQIQLP